MNPALLKTALAAVSAARAKTAFTPMDPSQMGGQQGGQPGGDPQGGSPPQPGAIDPSQIQGIGAGTGGGGGSGGGAVDQEMIRQVLKQELQQILPMLQGGGGGAGGGGAMGPGGKPMKIDVGVELHRVNVMLAKIIDALGIQIPASDMVTTEEQAQQPGAANADQTGAQLPPDSSIAPMQPIQPAGPQQHQQHQQHQHQANDKADLAKKTAELFMNQGECNAQESILPLSTQAAALSHIFKYLPAVQEQIA